MLATGLMLVAALLLLSALAVPAAHRAATRRLVYGGSLLLSVSLLAGSLFALLSRFEGELVLPLALPWLGAHFHGDALSCFFLVIVDLGAAVASLYGLGYGRHEEAPQRV